MKIVKSFGLEKILPCGIKVANPALVCKDVQIMLANFWAYYYICDPFWENLPIRADNFFPDLLIKALHYRLPFVWCVIRRYTCCVVLTI